MEMYCRECRYDLTGVGEYRCPECGLPFDPEDLTSFRQSPNKKQWVLGACSVILCGLLPIAIGLYGMAYEEAVHGSKQPLMGLLGGCYVGLLAAVVVGFVAYQLRRPRHRRWLIALLIIVLIIEVACIPIARFMINMAQNSPTGRIGG